MPSLFIVQQGIDEALQDTVVEAFFSGEYPDLVMTRGNTQTAHIGLYTALLLVTIAGFCMFGLSL